MQASYYVYDPSGNVLAIYNKAGIAVAIIAELPVYGSDRLGTYYTSGNNYVYELRDNVGSVRAVIARNKRTDGTVDVLTYSDYYPFGSIARNGGNGYRYEYQGAYAEKDPVTKYNNFDLRMYDGKIGRWLSIDPKMVGYSPYTGMANNPTITVDKDGGEPFWHWEGNKLMADANDNAITLANFLHISDDRAVSIFSNLANWDNGALMGKGLKDVLGHVLSDGPKPLYGNFLGEGPDGIYADPYNLTRMGQFQRPISETDAKAQIHDDVYWRKGVSGKSGAFIDLSVLEADRNLAKSSWNIWMRSTLGKNDRITHKPYTAGATGWAAGAATLFTIISVEKTIRVTVNDIMGTFRKPANETPVGYENVFPAFLPGN